MCAELTARGVNLLNGPMDRPWGVRTASFIDPGGHIWEIAKQQVIHSEAARPSVKSSSPVGSLGVNGSDIGENLKNSEMLAIFDKEVRRECEWTRMRREELPRLVRYTPTEVGNRGGFISWSDLTAESVETAIKEQIDTFRDLNLDFEWKHYSYDQPEDLPGRLLAHGFTAGEPEALMVADIDDLPAEFWTMDVSAVQRITTSQGLDEIERLLNEVWGTDHTGITAGLMDDLENNPNKLSVFAVWKDDRVVSAAWTHYLFSTSFATLWGGSTLKQYRNRGFYTSLLAVRAREAGQRGFRFLQVDASPESQPILAKQGFRCLAYSTPYEWKPK